MPLDPYAQPGYMQPYPGQQPPPKKKRGLMITLIVLALVVVLLGGGGTAVYFALKGAAGKGQASPVEAVNEFLKAVYKDRSAEAASKFVCPTARDKNALGKRIDAIRQYDATLKSPTYTWQTPTVQKQSDSLATVLAEVKVTTSDDREAKAKLSFVTTKDNGWWVCEINGG
jgi:hypothetical protein